jgi:hypothetical protein
MPQATKAHINYVSGIGYAEHVVVDNHHEYNGIFKPDLQRDVLSLAGCVYATYTGIIIDERGVINNGELHIMIGQIIDNVINFVAQIQDQPIP